MTRTVLCLALAALTLLAGLLTAKLCARNASRGEALYRLHLSNEMQAAHNELLAADVNSHLPELQNDRDDRPAVEVSE